MAKITIEFDEGAGVKVEHPDAPPLPPASQEADGGAAPADDFAGDTGALAPFDRAGSGVHDAGGPPAWLHEAMSGTATSPDAPPVSGDTPIDGGGAPEG
ncbi:MAG: hypothetical protein IT334_10950 [Thermomicrobiales bacterium]|nr:hypothetical protein [Thermomicrobiales bacterium]